MHCSIKIQRKVLKAAEILKCADRIYALMFDMEMVSIHPDKHTTRL